MSKIKLSFSSINKYLKCPKSYDLHYNKRLRPKFTAAALVMGSATDAALNTLLLTRDLSKSIETFNKEFSTITHNNASLDVPNSIYVLYDKRDFDYDLLQEEDKTRYFSLRQDLLGDSADSIKNNMSYFNDIKTKHGIDGLSIEERRLYGLASWLSLRRKGHVILKSYKEKVLPKIQEVIEIQKEISLKNDKGDEITGKTDLIVTWQNGKRYVLDNKTTYREYEKDSAGRSLQLIIYYKAFIEKYYLNGVGFITMNKSIMKNKSKICSKCGFDGSGTRFSTCNNDLSGDRCHGEWLEKIKPDCFIKEQLTEVHDKALETVKDTMNGVLTGVKNKFFPPNLNSCGSIETDYRCPYYFYCLVGSKEELIDLEENNETRKT